jgi:DNA repair ATPase RecN
LTVADYETSPDYAGVKRLSRTEIKKRLRQLDEEAERYTQRLRDVKALLEDYIRQFDAITALAMEIRMRLEDFMVSHKDRARLRDAFNALESLLSTPTKPDTPN